MRLVRLIKAVGILVLYVCPIFLFCNHLCHADVPDFTFTGGQEGYWRVGHDRSGVFWFVSPQGRREFLNTVTTVQPFQNSADGVSPAFRSADYEGDLAAWANKTAARVKHSGFKGLGAWCNEALYQCDLPFSHCLNLSTFPAQNATLIFAPGWRVAVENAVRDQVVPLRENKNLVGYFSDNELSWNDGGMGPRRYFDDLPEGDANRSEVVAVIKTLWPTAADFSRDWQVAPVTFDQLEHLAKLPTTSPWAYDRLLNSWIGHVAEVYFRTTTALIKKYDPNHLLLGVRYQGYAVAAVVRAARGLTDVQSINIYAGDCRLDPRTFTLITEESGQPVMISEFCFHALDGRSGNVNHCNFPALVANQKVRAENYRIFVQRLGQVPYIIGADWFQWMDEPPGGRADGEDVNCGLVDIFDRPYALLVDAVQKTAPTLNSLHSLSGYHPSQEIWRIVKTN